MLIDIIDYVISILLLSHFFYHMVIKENSFNKPIDNKAEFVEKPLLIVRVFKVLYFLWYFINFIVFTQKKLYTNEYNLTKTTLLVKLVGLSLYLTGLILRTWSINTLGNFFTYKLAILNEHKLIKVGPYRYLIHPSYTGMLMMLIGHLIFIQVSMCTAVISFAIWDFFLTRRIFKEEHVLRNKFKEEWEEYFKNRNRLIPYLF